MISVTAPLLSLARATEPVGYAGGRIPDFLMMHGQQDEQEVESAVEQNEHLTEREADVLRLLARGRSYAQAAAVLQAVRLGLIL